MVIVEDARLKAIISKLLDISDRISAETMILKRAEEQARDSKRRLESLISDREMFTQNDLNPILLKLLETRTNG